MKESRRKMTEIGRKSKRRTGNGGADRELLYGGSLNTKFAWIEIHIMKFTF